MYVNERLKYSIMKKEDVYKHLCLFDLRNPIGVISWGVTIEKSNYNYLTRENCDCDHCCSGQTELANYILDLQHQIEIL